MLVVGVWQKKIRDIPVLWSLLLLTQCDGVNMVMVIVMRRILAIWDFPWARHFLDISSFDSYKNEIDHIIMITALHMRKVGTEKFSKFSKVIQRVMAEVRFVLSQSVSRDCAGNRHPMTEWDGAGVWLGLRESHGNGAEQDISEKGFQNRVYSLVTLLGPQVLQDFILVFGKSVAYEGWIKFYFLCIAVKWMCPMDVW